MSDQPVASLAPARPSLRRDPDLDFLVIVPTCGDPAVLVPCVERVLRHAEPRTRIVIAFNAADRTKAADSMARIDALAPADGSVGVSMIQAGRGPVGFARAVNEGLRHTEANGGLAGLNVVLNDDARVTPGWLRGLQGAVDSPTVRVPAEPADASGTRPDRNAADYGRIGIVGPVSDKVAGIQQVNPPQGAFANLDAFAAAHRMRTTGEVMTADFISGFCVGITFAALDDLAEWAGGMAYDKVAPPKVAPWTSADDAIDLRDTGLGEKPGDGQAQYLSLIHI